MLKCASSGMGVGPKLALDKSLSILTKPPVYCATDWSTLALPLPLDQVGFSSAKCFWKNIIILYNQFTHIPFRKYEFNKKK